MTFRDLIAVSTGNLMRMKLRTFLTVSGVLIAIAAFVSMLSFGAGNQAYISKQYDELGLFNTVQVYPKPDSGKTNNAILDKAALEKLSNIPGVNLVYPYDAISAKAVLGDSSINAKAQALPTGAIKTKLFSKMLAGHSFDSDSADEAIVTDGLLRDLKIKNPDSVIGKQLLLEIKVSSIDSGLAHIFLGMEDRVRQLIETTEFDSLFHSKYRNRLIRTEANFAMKSFMDGFLNARETISDTLTICGVLSAERMGRLKIEPIIVPAATANRFNSAGFSTDPANLISSMSSGSIFAEPGDASGRSFSSVTLDIDSRTPYKPIKDSITALGFRPFSFAEQFEEIRKAFFYFDLALGMIGLIALITSALGIINTMVMSILERKREIGVLKSLGADDSDIRILFLFESGVIGAIGAVCGILFGWLISRAASGVAQFYMTREGVPPMDLFALPIWLILIALAIGVVVSVVAGLYPAARASHVDPVEALRGE